MVSMTLIPSVSAKHPAFTMTLPLLGTLAATAALVGLLIRRGRNTEGQELALLADAHAVERLAAVLLANARGGLMLQDAPDCGRRVLSLRVARGGARGARMAMEYGGDKSIANRRLHRSKEAFATAIGDSRTCRDHVAPPITPGPDGTSRPRHDR